MGTTVAFTDLAPQTKPPQPTVISIPGTKRQTSRRAAHNHAASASAYVVPDSKSKILSTLNVSVKRNSRLMPITLDGHKAQVVDLEFLASSPSEPIYVLGSCDTEGVVFLWFLYIAKDALGIDVGLTLLKKYSFYSLRRSTAAFYTHIRLAGTPEDGTMVLVPNDGHNCRVVNFSCKAFQPEDASTIAAIGAPDPVPQLPPPEQTPPQADKAAVPSEKKEEEAGPSGGAVAGAAAGMVAGAAAGAAVVDPSNDAVGQRVLGEGLQGDEEGEGIGGTTDTFVHGTTVEDAAEEDVDEYNDTVERVMPAVDEVEAVYGEGVIETPTPAYAVTGSEEIGGRVLSGEYEREVDTEEVIAEEVIDDDEEEIEEEEEEEYEEYEEPEIERVYGEGLSNGHHEPNYAGPY